MRIVVHGQQAFGKAVLDALIERKEDVVGVYVAPDRAGEKPDVLKDAAIAAGLPLHQPKSFRDPAAAETFRQLKPDLQVMAYVTLYVPSAFLEIPTHRSIQYHPSLLPRHRGPSSINWPIIMGEKETGLTIFWPDDGLDTGDILLQKKTPIGPDDTLGSVYFDRLFPMGVAAVLEAIDLVKDGRAPRIKQDDSRATYEGWCGHDNARIDWAKPIGQTYDLIRGCNPQPGAWTTLDGQLLRVYEAQPIPARQPGGIGGRMGEVVAIDEDGLAVACADGRMRLRRLKLAEGPKVKAAELVARVGLKPGARLV